MTCPTQALSQPLTLDRLKEEVKAIYKPLLWRTFKGSVIDINNTTAVCTGGPRDVVQVESKDTQQLMQTIVNAVEAVSRRYKPDQPGEKVWKGITTYNLSYQLWVKSCQSYGSTQFTVKDIEVVTHLNWVMSYEALVNITLS